MRKIAVIPVYRELGLIGKTIRKFDRRFVDEICVVVDCPSREIIGEITASAETVSIPTKIIRNPKRKGIGYAIKKGIRYALQKRYDVIVVLSGSDKDNPREIPRVLNKIINENCDYVQGSRFLRGGKSGNIPFVRKLIVRFYPVVWTITTGIRCTDVTNGFRAYRTKIFDDRRIDIWQDWLNDYGLEYYIHFKVLALGYKTAEVPVSRIYPLTSSGRYSKINPLRDFWSIAGPLFYLRFGLRS